MAAEEVAVVTVVPGETEAELVCGLLRANGIKCGYRDTESIDSPIEDFIASGPREVLVAPIDLEAAQQLLKESGPS
jgi:hypothetical protein